MCHIIVLSVFIATSIFLVKGIRKVVNLKTIEDVDTYYKNFKLSVIFLSIGLVGIGALAAIVWLYKEHSIPLWYSR